MKKIFTFIAAIILLFCSTAYASRENEAYDWCTKLPTDATFMFDYSYMQPTQLKKVPAYNCWEKITSYYLTSAFIGGFRKCEFNVDTSISETVNVVPVNLNKNGTFVFPIVTKAHTLVGLVWATVENGTVMIDGQLREQVQIYEPFTLYIYTNLYQLLYNGTEYEFGEELSFNTDVIYFEISGKVQYHWIIGSSRESNCSTYWQLNEYWRYERKWRVYRNYVMDYMFDV